MDAIAPSKFLNVSCHPWQEQMISSRYFSFATVWRKFELLIFSRLLWFRVTKRFSFSFFFIQEWKCWCSLDTSSTSHSKSAWPYIHELIPRHSRSGFSPSGEQNSRFNQVALCCWDHVWLQVWCSFSEMTCKFCFCFANPQNIFSKSHSGLFFSYCLANVKLFSCFLLINCGSERRTCLPIKMLQFEFTSCCISIFLRARKP